MIISGFLTYTSEALYFIDDPKNILEEKHRFFFDILRFIYNILCLITLGLLSLYSFKIFYKFKKIQRREKFYFLFSIYFFFTINLCKLKSYFNRKYFYLFSKWRKSTFSYYYK